MWRPYGKNDDGHMSEVGEHLVGDRLSNRDRSEDRNGTVSDGYRSRDAVIVINDMG